MKALPLAWRGLRREWRLPELRTLAAALVLAVAALGAVASLGARVEQALLARAAEMLGGNLGVSTDYRNLPADFSAEATRLGLQQNHSANFPSMAFHGEASQLLDVLATDPAWPLRGHAQLAAGNGRVYDGHGPARGEVYLDQRALDALHLRIGDTLQFGGMRLRVAARLVQMPDGGELFALAPRAVVNLADADAAGLLGAGSRASHRLLLAGAPAQIAAYARWAKAHLPGGARLITPTDVQQRLRFAFNRASTLLRLIALLSALLSGIAIALAARRYALRKIDEVALLRALGAPRRQVLGLLATRLGSIALTALAVGVLLALVLAALAWHLAQALLPQPAPPLSIAPALGAALAGLAVLLGFALPPLTRLASVPPQAVFRRSLGALRWRDRLLYLLPLPVALGLILAQGGGLKLSLGLGLSLIGVGAAAALISAALLALARHTAAHAHPALRIGLASLARRRGLSLLQSVALSLGLSALLLLAVVTPALLSQWQRELPPDTPNWFALNVQGAQRASLARQVAQAGGTELNMLPLVVGNLSTINGVPIAQRHFADAATRRWAEQTLRLSWSTQPPPGNSVVAGHWFSAQPRMAEVSVDRGWARRFGIKLGDTLGFQVGEQNLDARVTSLREVRWDSFRVNFFLLLDPAHGHSLAHNWLASFHLPPGQATRLQATSRALPNVSLIDVDSLLTRLRGIVAQVGTALRWVLGFSLLAGALVLVAALTASARERRHEAALLRTLGADRRQLLLASIAEFAMLGAIAAFTGALGALATGQWLALNMLDLPHFIVPLRPLLLAMLVTVSVVTLLGLAGTHKLLSSSPLRILRQE